MKKHKVLGYFLYGDDRKYKLELFFSIFSALKHLNGSDEVTVAVVTDRADLDPALPIDVIRISAEELEQWMQGGYNHRAKPFAILKLLDHYDCPVAMVDTDTYFLQSPAQLFDRITPAQTVMYEREAEAIAAQPDCQRFVERLGEGVAIGDLPLTPRTPMYNSGVIGVEPSHRALIEQAIAVIDAIVAIDPVFTAEQIAVGAVLDRQTQIVASDDLLHHYYHFSRHFVHAQIDRLVPELSARTLEKLLQNPFPGVVPYPAMPLRDRVLARCLGWVWRWDDNYRYAYLTYRCALSGADQTGADQTGADQTGADQTAGYADAWSKVTLHCLKVAQITGRSLSSMRRDFPRLQPEQLHQLSWLSPATKVAWQQFWQPLA